MEPETLEATVERCREGDEDAWSALVSTTVRPIYRLCASYSPSAAEAEELTQDVYFKLWENLHRYRAGSNFMAWAWRVAKNLLIDAHRRSRRERSAAWVHFDPAWAGQDEFARVAYQRRGRMGRLRSHSRRIRWI